MLGTERLLNTVKVRGIRKGSTGVTDGVVLAELGLGAVGLAVCGVVASPFLLQGALLGALERKLWEKGLMDWNPSYPERKRR
jgi:hypothetical protein